MSNLLTKLKFALHYDFPLEFVVVPFGAESYLRACRFVSYKDAKRYAEEQAKLNPQFLQPAVLMIVEKL